MSRRLPGLITLVVCLAAGPAATAQTTSDGSATPAHVSVVQGTALVERDGQAEAVTENLPLLEGDRLRTEAGRIEAILPDGSVLAIDHNSTLDLLAGGLMRLPRGRLVFVVSRPLDGEARGEYQIDAPAGTVRFTMSGEYRLSATAVSGAAGLEVAVVRGEAVVGAAGEPVSVTAGQLAVLTEGRGVSSTRTFNSAYTDAFYAWADLLRAERVGSRSNAYLPPDLRVYGGTFDRDGWWGNEPDYGSVWYPRVATDWRPYYDGSWEPYDWGWTWVGAGRWTWPTHHYGRWGHGASGWFWSPGALWGPAWVSWGFSNDYVSWCPLGWNDSPVFGLSFGFSLGSRYNPWLGWTVVPHHAFGRSYRVPSYAVRGDRLRAVERSSFAVRRAGPATAGMARSRTGRADSPYDRAQAAAGERADRSQGWGTTRGGSTNGRPSVAERPWSSDPSSPYGRAQSVAGERLRQAEPGAAARSRSYDTRPFASPSQTPLPYPERFRSTVGPQNRQSGPGAVPRSQAIPRTPSGLSQPRGSGQPTSAAPRTYSSPGGSAVPRSYGSYLSPGYRSPSGAVPRSYQQAQPSGPTRSYSTPSYGGGRSSAPSSPGFGGRSPGGSSGSSGGRVSGGSSSGGGRPSGGGRSSGGGRPSGGGSGRGGRGK